MWESLIAILETVLEIVKEFLTWQVALTKIKVRKLSYDIDQEQLHKGRELLAKIDSARTSNDLPAVSLLLDDAAANALYAANVRSAIPGVSGLDVGVGGGIPKSRAPSSGPDNSPEPTAQPKPDSAPAAVVVDDKPKPIHIIPTAPYSVTGMATWFGWNPDRTDDTGDMDKQGRDLKGAFGDETHNEQIVGLSIPIPIFHATIGSKDEDYREVANRRYSFDVWSHSTGKHAAGVWLVDLGPQASLNRVADMTYGLGTMLGLKDNAIISWSVTDTHTGQIMEIKGYDFINNKVNV